MVSRFCTICAICTKGGIIMQPTEKLNQANLAKWAQIISEQKSSSLTIRDWCLQNNISYHAYNYWKHKLKESFISILFFLILFQLFIRLLHHFCTNRAILTKQAKHSILYTASASPVPPSQMGT